jgi:hypothetical protein
MRVLLLPALGVRALVAVTTVWVADDDREPYAIGLWGDGIDKPFLDCLGRPPGNFTRVETFGDNQGNGTNDVNWLKVLLDARSREVFAFPTRDRSGLVSRDRCTHPDSLSPQLRLAKPAQILYNLMFVHQVLNDSGEQSDGTGL